MRWCWCCVNGYCWQKCRGYTVQNHCALRSIWQSILATTFWCSGSGVSHEVLPACTTGMRCGMCRWSTVSHVCLQMWNTDIGTVNSDLNFIKSRLQYCTVYDVNDKVREQASQDVLSFRCFTERLKKKIPQKKKKGWERRARNEGVIRCVKIICRLSQKRHCRRGCKSTAVEVQHVCTWHWWF